MAGRGFWVLPSGAGRAIGVEYRAVEASPPPSGGKQRAASGQERFPSDISETPSKEETVSLDTPDPKYRLYFLKVKEKILNHWGAPRVLPGEPNTGALLVDFTLGRGGKLLAAMVMETSGKKGLDLAALDAVKEASPYDTFPPHIDQDKIRIRALFVYE